MTITFSVILWMQEPEKKSPFHASIKRPVCRIGGHLVVGLQIATNCIPLVFQACRRTYTVAAEFNNQFSLIRVQRLQRFT